MKSNVIKREFLYNCQLYIYLQDSELVGYLRNPYFSLVLGRSGDLATVEEIKELDDNEFVKNSMSENIKGQIVPFTGNYLPGEIQALPKYFTNSIPRNNLGTEPYSVISHDSGSGYTDLVVYTDIIDEKEIDIYFHELNF